jgi:hypothetical protein
MKIKIRTLDGSLYEVEESLLQAYKVPAEEIERQLQHLKSSLRLDLAKEFAGSARRRAASKRAKQPQRRDRSRRRESRWSPGSHM